MTRKRFVKLLMAQGYSRNEANAAARSARKGQPYAELYFEAWLRDLQPTTWDDLTESLFSAGASAAKAATEAMQRVCEALLRISQAANEVARQFQENTHRLQAADEGNPSE